MDFETILANALNTVVVTAVTVGIGFLVKYLQGKSKSDKLDWYIEKAGDIIRDTVIRVNQTYVDALKASGEFTDEQKAEAKATALDIIYDTLSETAYSALTVAYGDVEAWIVSKLEAFVKEQKSTKA